MTNGKKGWQYEPMTSFAARAENELHQILDMPAEGLTIAEAGVVFNKLARVLNAVGAFRQYVGERQ